MFPQQIHDRLTDAGPADKIIDRKIWAVLSGLRQRVGSGRSQTLQGRKRQARVVSCQTLQRRS